MERAVVAAGGMSGRASRLLQHQRFRGIDFNGRVPQHLRRRLHLAIGQLLAGATRARKGLATFAMDGEVRFASAADRAAFAEELATAVTGLIGKYHDESANGGREHRVIVAVHPSLKPKGETERKEP